MDTINKVENVTSREKERERTSKANIDRAINDKLTSSRNGLLVKHALKNIKKKPANLTALNGGARGFPRFSMARSVLRCARAKAGGKKKSENGL